jgi:hypothetical protein
MDMFGDFLKGMKNSGFGAPEAPLADPKKFNDSVAEKCGWHPMKGGAANFTTHKLKQTGENLAYKPTPSVLAMGTLFTLAGLGLLAAFLVNTSSHWILPLVGLVFLGAGIFILIQSASPAFFDSKSKTVGKGSGKKTVAGFDDIHGVQLLTKVGRVSGNSESYQRDTYFYAYEMNLVRHDGQRVYLMTYTKKNQAIEDAGRISKLLGCPVWDGTS